MKMEGRMRDDFRFFKLSLASRLVISGFVFALGIAVELAMGGRYLPGMVVVAAGWLPLMLKKATNKPEDQGLEEWRPVPMAEIDRLDDGLAESAKLRRRTRSLSAPVAVAVAIPAFIALGVVTAILDRSDFNFVGLNAALLFIPSLFFGRVNVFTPSEIAMKMPCFRAMLSGHLPEGIAVAPYIRFDKDRSGADCPEDLRLLLELKRPPADLVGVQLQAAINNGPNGAVPYMYAVVLTKGKEGGSYKIAQRVKRAGYEVEAGGDDKYGTVVLRQETGGGGYETSSSDCERLLGLCVDLLGQIAAKA
jgi:hypothetical protein